LESLRDDVRIIKSRFR